MTIAEVGAEPATTVDWTITWGKRPIDPTIAPAGRPVVVEGVWPAVREGDIVTLWHIELGRIVLDLQARTIELMLTIQTDEVGALLLRGVALSLALELSDITVLHANGVLIGGNVIAVAGPRGIGKTTVTAALCAAGADLYADDVVAVDHDDVGWFGRSGLTELRLRSGAAHLADMIGDRFDRQASVDGRSVVVLPTPGSDRAPLGAIVVPRIVQSAAGPSLVALTGTEAFTHLAVSFRIITFVDPERLVARMRVTAELARQVPVYALVMAVQEQWTHDDAARLHELFEQAFTGR